MIALVWSADAAAAGSACPAPVDAIVWSAELQAAEDAFSQLDERGFDEAMTHAGADLDCLSAPVDAPLAARYHRLVGLRRFVRHDEDGARLAFAAARAVEPYGALPSVLLPPGHEARLLSDRATTPGDTTPVPAARGGLLRFDGAEGRRRPADRPTIFQVEQDGVVTQTVYLGPTDALPTYASTRHAAAHWAIGGAGVALAVGGAVTYGFAMDAAGTVRGDLPDTTTRADVLALQARANDLTLVSAAAGALGLLGVTVAVVRW